ncbi:hypothetical protein [Thorsellia kenyensis]|uniref:Secreted protein n=1 Tax=Thorsellia kenyensis TaxID=1549888 RepID=A0ABV6CAD2_9GAMM
MKNILIVLLFGFYSLAISANFDEKLTIDNLVDEYKTYSLAYCIEENYKKMGIDFKQLPYKDITLGFIDTDMGVGFGFNTQPTNVLDEYIEMKTGHFYQPAHKEGDMSSVNLVIYHCAHFYESQELKDFLKKQIPLRMQKN